MDDYRLEFADLTTDTFLADERKQLQRRLLDDANDLRVDPIGSAERYCLTASGRTADNYTYTLEAFTQLCGLMLPTLSTTLLDMANYRRDATVPRGAVSAEDAIECFNRILRRRCRPILATNCAMVVSRKRRLYVGALGSATTYCDNASLFELIESAAEGSRAKLAWAEVRGARIFCLFLCPEPIAVVSGMRRLKFRIGCGVSADIGGKSSVRFFQAVADVETAGCAVVVPSGGTLKHFGHRFDKRLQTAARRLSGRMDDTDWLAFRLKRLAEMPLGLDSTDYQANMRRAEKLARSLQWMKLPNPMRLAVVAKTIAPAVETIKESMSAALRNEMAGLTGLDLFLSLIRLSVDSEYASRRRMEFAAGDWLRTGELYEQIESRGIAQGEVDIKIPRNLKGPRGAGKEGRRPRAR